MNLGSLAIVLVLARKGLVLEAIQNLGDSLCGLGQHGLKGYAGLQLAVLAEVHDTVLDHGRNDNIIAGELAAYCALVDNPGRIGTSGNVPVYSLEHGLGFFNVGRAGCLAFLGRFVVDDGLGQGNKDSPLRQT